MANENTTYIKRTPIDLLPSYFQTDSLKKFFNATVNHLFQPASVEFLNGYVGQIPAWYNSTTDFYIPEPNSNRKNYQLDPTIVSATYQNPELSNAMFYEDLINQLNFQGAITNNHNRLFNQEYYSWSPPIELDMFVNYTNYYWLPNGPDAIELLNTTDLNNTAVGQTQYSYVGTVKYLANNTIATFTEADPLVFSTGLKIIPTADLTISLNGKQLIIGGVGQSIQLINITDNAARSWDLSGWDLYGWDGIANSTPLYITIERGSNDNNQWSANNGWYHIDIIMLSQSSSSDLYQQQAQRPILQFDKNLELYNYGTNNRGTISIVDTQNTDILNSIVGQPHWSIEGIPLQDGMRILGLADKNAKAAGRIFIVGGISQGAISLTVDTFGCLHSNGDPAIGDRATVQFGTLQGQNILYSSAGWSNNCQQQIGLIPPLFQCYDTNGNRLDDPSVYPHSSFAGSQLFSYSVDSSQPVDPYIGQSLELDQFGDWVFNNNLSTNTFSFVLDGTNTAYNGYIFAKISNGNESSYTNSWYTAPQLSRQYIINQYNVIRPTTNITIDQEPAVQSPNTLPTIFVYVTANQNQTLLTNNVDYTVSGNTITLVQPAQVGSIITIASWNPVAPNSITGYYQIPLNISANPNNLPVTTLSRSQFLQQFQEIIQNQTGISGPALGSNNYRDTAQVKGLGLSILQHSAPVLKLGMLNSVPLASINLTTAYTDPMQSMQYAENSYTRFYNRLLNALFALSVNPSYAASSDASACEAYNTSKLLTDALNRINIGKTPASPWANTGYGGYPGAYGQIQAAIPLYIPATATRLGITPAYQPQVYYDLSYSTPKLTIQTHDGARIIMIDQQGLPLGTILNNQYFTTNPEQLTNPVAAAWLQFELNMFNNLPPSYSNIDTTLAFNITAYSPGKWRTSDYSQTEFISLQRGFFDRWCNQNQVNFADNTTYNEQDPFSYNYSSVNDKQGQPIPGYWQGIYRWFYDTDRPHTHPWEMLGFSQKPSWWDNQYGPAPYTSGNTALWEDLRDGIIRQGARQGTDSTYVRPGLMSCIPVDTQGNLLPPVLAGCAAYIPSKSAARAAWVFGDGGPVESAWYYSQYYPFVSSMTAYLMKPAAFIEYTWDSLRTEYIYANTPNSQLIYIDTNARRSSNQFYINREIPSALVTGTYVPNESDLNYFASAGFQVWISEYVVSQGLSVTSYVGNLIRGANVQLGHRMAGYINLSNFRALVDSFGQLGFNSQIVPAENIKNYLYRSTSTGIYFYSGVVVQQVQNGWLVYGYDATNPVFTVIPNNTAGPKNNIVVGNQKVTEYTTGLVGQTKTVYYNSLMTTYQEVYDFLVGYGRWLTSQGWIFDQYDSNLGNVLDWTQSAKEFLLWAQGSWANGTVLTLSPSSQSVQFATTFGMVQYVNGIIAGTYPVVDRSGNPILSQNLSITRTDTAVTIQPTNDQGIYGVRLFTTTLEHAVFFDNETAFGDIIYSPLYNLQQERIKIYTYRANGWNGTIDAPGYLVIQNNATVNGQTVSSNTWTLTDNFEKTVSDFTRYFNIDEPTNYQSIQFGGGNIITSTTTLGAIDDQNISALSKHLIGYQPRQYLQNLLIDESVEFQFYQGFIRQKGTLASINSLLRSSTVIPTGSTFNYYDEWMIRVGTYGATALNVEMEFILPQAGINYDPQWIRFFAATSNNPFSNVFDILPNDPLLITPPKNYSTDIFATRPTFVNNRNTDIPTAGYAQLGETNWYVVNTSNLLQLYLEQYNTITPLQPYDTVWQFITDNSSWMVWVLAPALSSVSYTVQSQSSGQPTIIVTNGPHGLLNGDAVVVNNVAGVPEINDTYIISSVTSTTFSISLSTFTAGAGGNIYVYRPMRFANLFDRDTSSPPGGYQNGMIVYVDEGGIVPGAWTVYKFVNNEFVQYRQENLKVNPDLIESSEIYNLKTGANLANLDYWDPAKGKIPGQAEAELNYITDFDPAKYTSGDTTGYAVNSTLAWSSAQIGQTWWDVSQVRYIDYEQGDESYRLRTWGQIAPGTQVVVYEWVESSISPIDWQTAVAQQTPITVNGNVIIPSGTVKSPYNWTEQTQYNSQKVPTTHYYFWVGNSSMSPTATSRTLSTLALTNYILQPAQTNTPWFAAISTNSIIIGNVQNLLVGDDIAQRINYTSQQNNANIYSQWELIRQNDPSSPINPTVWSKLKSSLVTVDGLGNDVPDYKLNEYNKYGTFIRPRQTWFVDRVAAANLFVSTFNNLIASSSVPLVYDATRTNWLNYFTASEPLPPQYSTTSFVISGTTSNKLVITQSTEGLVVEQPIIFADSVGTIIANITYFVAKIYSQTEFSISAQQGTAELVLTNSSASTTASQTITNWDYQVPDINSRNNLIGAINFGQKILVGPNLVTQNRWTIWLYEPIDPRIWILVQMQSYNTNQYWQYVNWYASGYDAQNTPTQSVATIADLDAISNPIPGQLIQVQNGGDGNYQWYVYNGGNWNLVCQQNGSVQLLPSLYDWSTYIGGFDTVPFDGSGTNLVFNPTAGFDPNAATEFSYIIDGIYYAIYPGPNSIELNQLFFAMIDFVVAEQTDVDWIFKTSNIVFTGFNQPLAESPILAVDNTSSILGFINEAKPYHAQIQAYINGYSANDTGNVAVVDFDVPFSYLTEGTPGTAQLPSNITVTSSNLEYQEYSSTYTSWYNNYQPAQYLNEQSYIDPSLIRTLSTKIVFDRISTPALIPGWGSIWSIFGWDAETAGQNFGAITRIESYYEPTAGMLPNVLSDLMQGVAYKGQIIGNLGFKAEPGWDGGPWGGTLGWDADSNVINAYLDQIIQGGALPQYTSIIGDGQTISYQLLPGAQNPNNLVVWTDGDLRLYAVDWIVPTFATNAYVVNGGSGYQVGDQLNIIAGTCAVPVRLKVTEVSHGSITSVEIIGKGSYSTVTPGPYNTEYPQSYPGLGSSASIDIDWECSVIQFTTAPAGSDKPNVYVLYIGTTFESAPTNTSDSIYDGYKFVQPYVDENHPEELYPMLPRDCLIMDTWSVPVSGRPTVANRVYITDGETEQFDLLVLPQNNDAVMAYLNGVPLTIGIGGDAVVNFDTRKLVMVNRPSAGQLLYITSIGFGGSGQSVQGAYIVNSGTGYKTGDLIYLTASMAYPPNVEPAVLKVNEVSKTKIVSVSVESPGLYPRIPDQPVMQSSTTGSGQGATFNLEWTNRFDIYKFIGDGSTTIFTIPDFIPGTTGVLVNVNGQVVGYTLFNNGIQLVQVPPYGSSILIAVFADQNFSTVTENVFTITIPNYYNYPITVAGSSAPAYLSTLVRKNGKLMSPPVIQQFNGDGTLQAFTITVDTSNATSLQVYIDDVLQPSSAYSIVNNLLSFNVAPLNQSNITLLCIGASTEYLIAGGNISFAPGSISVGDVIIVTTYTQDVDYQFRTDEFVENNAGQYVLSAYPSDFSTIQVWYNNVLQVPLHDYNLSIIPGNSGWSTGGRDVYMWDENVPTRVSVDIQPTDGWGMVWDSAKGWSYVGQLVVTYMLGRENAPGIAWRTTTGWDETLSTVIDTTRQTYLLGDLYTYSVAITVADFTVLTPPQYQIPGLVYINDELISFTDIVQSPTASYPNRALLTGIQRDRLGTSGSPETLYNCQYYNGDGFETFFAIESATQAISTSVYVNEVLQVENKDYVITTNLPGNTVGVQFNVPPTVGTKNVQIISLNQISYKTQISHVNGSAVIDAGRDVQIPGGYNWEPTPNGLQYSTSNMALFLLEHSISG